MLFTILYRIKNINYFPNVPPSTMEDMLKHNYECFFNNRQMTATNRIFNLTDGVCILIFK